MKLILFLAIGHRAAGDRGCPEKSLREVWVFFGVYLAAAWACLWQWGSPHPPSRIDLFSGGFFTLAAALVFREPDILEERERHEGAPARGASYAGAVRISL